MYKKGFISYQYYGNYIELDFEIGKKTENNNISITTEIDKNILKVNIKALERITIDKLIIELSVKYNKEDRVFLNGFQSWTDSREFETDEKIPKLLKLAQKKLQNYGDYTFYKYSGKKGILQAWSYTYIRKNKDNVLFYGSLNEGTGYTIFQHNTNNDELIIIKDCKSLKLETNQNFDAFKIFCMEGLEQEVFDGYFNNLNIEKPKDKLLSGWTSWYNYYTGIDEKTVLENLDAFSSKNIPINVIQIDDGFQNSIGDWLIINEKFPKGMKYLADKIHENGYKAGLWLAPFICSKNSKLFVENNDWVLKDEEGNPIIAGFNPGWDGYFYAVDIYNEGLRSYLREVFNTVLNEWDYDIVKLDFLYAAAIRNREGKTRGQIMTEAMKFLREICGKKQILGCGVPLAPSYGLVDFCRIGCDVGLKWNADKILDFANYREAISTKNTLISTIGRRQLNAKAFVNDPDVFILRSENTSLTKEQKKTLFLTNLLFGGLVFTSDNISTYSNDEMNTYLSQFPMKEKNIKGVYIEKDIYKVNFKIEDRTYLTLINLGNNACNIKLDEGIYFSNEMLAFVIGDSNYYLEPYSSICLYKLNDEGFDLLGGKSHIFSGCEVEEFKVKWKSITIKRHKNSMNNDKIFIKIPDEFDEYKVNGKMIKAEDYKGIKCVTCD